MGIQGCTSVISSLLNTIECLFISCASLQYHLMTDALFEPNTALAWLLDDICFHLIHSKWMFCNFCQLWWAQLWWTSYLSSNIQHLLMKNSCIGLSNTLVIMIISQKNVAVLLRVLMKLLRTNLNIFMFDWINFKVKVSIQFDYLQPLLPQ